MSTFTAEPLIVGQGYDETSDVGKVVEATRHLCDFRTGQAEILVRLAEEATEHLPTEGHARLEPALRILGPERALRYAGRLYRIASDVTRTDRPDGGPSLEEAERTLRVVADQAAHAVADEFHRDNRICCNATKGAGQ